MEDGRMEEGSESQWCQEISKVLELRRMGGEENWRKAELT